MKTKKKSKKKFYSNQIFYLLKILEFFIFQGLIHETDCPRIFKKSKKQLKSFIMCYMIIYSILI